MRWRVGQGVASQAALEETGQMVVEMAVMVPVVLVVAIIALNGCYYLNLCARFDRVALDMALAHGVSPPGEQDATQAAATVKQALQEAMGDDVEISVAVESIDPLAEGIFSLSPTRVRFVCSMGYRPYPSGLSLGGVSVQFPVVATHERSVAVDAGTIGLGSDAYA